MDVFWRPVPSLLIEGSVRLFGETAFPLHLLSVLVHGLVAGTLFLFVRRLTRRPGVALLAGLVLLSCEDHSMGVGWIATVTDLICVLFVNLSLIAHSAWLSKRRPWHLVASLAALILALLSKESAVVAPLAIVLMTLLLPHGQDEELPEPSISAIRQRWSAFIRDWPSWVPSIVLLGIYLTAYRLIGFGGISTGLYVDPLSEPGRFVSHLVLHLPIMWLATLSPVPPSMTLFMPELGVPLAVLGTLAFLGLLAGLWFLRRQALVVWSLAVYVLALLPQMSTDGSDVLAVRFEIDRPLDDPSLLFLQWDGEAFIPLDLAELPPGQSVTLADTSDVWASLW